MPYICSVYESKKSDKQFFWPNLNTVSWPLGLLAEVALAIPQLYPKTHNPIDSMGLKSDAW